MTQSPAPQIALVGIGKMGGAFLAGLLRSGRFQPDQIIAITRSEAAAANVHAEHGVRTFSHYPADLRCALFLLAVKPHQTAETLRTIAAQNPPPPLLSLVAGWPVSRLQDALGNADAPVIRAMPNSPAAIGCGVTAYSPSPSCPSDVVDLAHSILTAVGTAHRIEEPLMNAATALAGSGPAYLFLFLEALIDAGVRQGIPRPLARAMALETFTGSLQLAATTGKHPALLREEVTSPGGTTIAGLEALEKQGLRSALFAAVEAATRRSAELGQ